MEDRYIMDKMNNPEYEVRLVKKDSREGKAFEKMPKFYSRVVLAVALMGGFLGYNLAEKQVNDKYKGKIAEQYKLYQEARITQNKLTVLTAEIGQESLKNNNLNKTEKDITRKLLDDIINNCNKSIEQAEKERNELEEVLR